MIKPHLAENRKIYLVTPHPVFALTFLELAINNGRLSGLFWTLMPSKHHFNEAEELVTALTFLAFVWFNSSYIRANCFMEQKAASL